MADTLDALTLTEAKNALNIAATISTFDAELAEYITAVSRRLDDLCGPIVLRTYTDEEYPGGRSHIILRHAPASETSATTITTVKEWSAGTSTTLAAQTTAASTVNDFYFDQKQGILYRRASWTDVGFAYQAVTVTYSAGRYASTAAVDEKFKQAARTMLLHLWRPEQGTPSVTFPGEVPIPASQVPGFLLPNVVVDLLSNEIQPKSVFG